MSVADENGHQKTDNEAAESRSSFWLNFREVVYKLPE